MEGYINKLAVEHEIHPDELSAIPSSTDLFHPPVDKTPYNLKQYQKLIGGLIYCVKIRHDVRKEIVYLATRTSNPTKTDYQKARRVLVYLKTTAKLGPTFYTNEGVVLHAYADSSHGVHLSEGRSHSGYYISIGKYSVPICCYSSMQKSCVALSSCEAEYVCLSDCAKKVQHFRALLQELGWKQDEPTILYEDNESAIKLATTAQIPRASRHVNIKYHHVRDLIKQKELIVTWLETNKMTADLLTKPLGSAKFITFRDLLLNTNSSIKKV